MRSLAAACAVGALLAPASAYGARKSAKPEHAAGAASEGRVALAIALGALLLIPVVWSLLDIGWWELRRLFGYSGSSKPPMRWGFWSFVGFDNRISTSKTVAIVWTYSVASTILSLLVARWLGYPEALEHFEKQGLQAEYGLLFGGPLGAAILAKGIVKTGVENGTSAKPAASSPNPVDLVSNDAGETELGDLQYVLFNIVALVFFWSEFLRFPYKALPTIPGAILGLTSVAAAGYVANKSLASLPMITSVNPPQGLVGQGVRLVCSGLLRAGDDPRLVSVTFGGAKDPLPPVLSFTATQGALLDLTVPEAAGLVEIVVTTPSGKKAVWQNYPIEPRLLEPIPNAQRGQPVMLKTTGVLPLGRALSGLKVKIAGAVAGNAAIEGGELKVVVPQSIAAGRHPIELVTPGGSDTGKMINVAR